MSKKRVHEIAKEFGVESKQVISILQQHNVNVTKAVNSVDDSGYEIVKKQLSKKSEAPKVAQKTEQKVEQKSAPTAAHKQDAAPHKQQHPNRSNEQKRIIVNKVVKNKTINLNKTTAKKAMYVTYKFLSLHVNPMVTNMVVTALITALITIITAIMTTAIITVVLMMRVIMIIAITTIETMITAILITMIVVTRKIKKVVTTALNPCYLHLCKRKRIA